MPYIKKDAKLRLSASLELPQNAGELNYLISLLCINTLTKWGKSYDSINKIVGALECAKLELYRRVAAPYEDEKIKENGDVYF